MLRVLDPQLLNNMSLRKSTALFIAGVEATKTNGQATAEGQAFIDQVAREKQRLGETLFLDNKPFNAREQMGDPRDLLRPSLLPPVPAQESKKFEHSKTTQPAAATQVAHTEMLPAYPALEAEKEASNAEKAEMVAETGEEAERPVSPSKVDEKALRVDADKAEADLETISAGVPASLEVLAEKAEEAAVAAVSEEDPKKAAVAEAEAAKAAEAAAEAATEQDNQAPEKPAPKVAIEAPTQIKDPDFARPASLKAAVFAPSPAAAHIVFSGPVHFSGPTTFGVSITAGHTSEVNHNTLHVAPSVNNSLVGVDNRGERDGLNVD